ncbi:unnamed protein product [Cylicostephanus goldi]|uniref:Choline/carnitine acyltransferase domain-containing protein n=1 Tax=Cylicostephanus goldi TaxID=71465 RepID=A0A3P7NR69_CYLGO|nr:unnamed protein product [Cylicostephanus goldi]
MYEQPGKPISTPTKLWLGVLKLMSKSGPMMHSYQGALPHLPLPSLNDTIEKHLLSMRPILNDEEFEELEHLSEVFRKGLGRRLQRYLQLKSWLSTNYVRISYSPITVSGLAYFKSQVTDWWEEFVYMRQRSPIMINSNYYGFVNSHASYHKIDTLNEHPTHNQAARAANTVLIYVIQFSVSPRTKVPFCTMQYERLFNSCRVPGEEVKP